METRSQTVVGDYRPSSDMVRHVQQLQQSGFNDGQVRALASFVGEVARDAMRPFIERVDQRFDDMQARMDQRFDDMQAHMDQRFEAVDQRFGTADRRFDATDQRFEAVDRRFDSVDRRLDGMNRRVAHVEARLGKVEAHVDDAKRRLGRVEMRVGETGESVARLSGEIAGMRHSKRVAIAMLVLGFASIVASIFLVAWIAA